MSELIQESKYITVDEFMPKWTDIVEGGKVIPNTSYIMDDSNEISLTKTNSCLVGEAHGLKPWKNNYTDNLGDNFCGKCKRISLGEDVVNGVNFYDAVRSLKYLYTFKQGVYDHFMEAHPEKLLRKGI